MLSTFFHLYQGFFFFFFSESVKERARQKWAEKRDERTGAGRRKAGIREQVGWGGKRGEKKEGKFTVFCN